MSGEEHMLAAIVAELQNTVIFQTKTIAGNNSFDEKVGVAAAISADAFGSVGAFRFTARAPGRVMVHARIFKNDAQTSNITLGASLNGAADVSGNLLSLGNAASSSGFAVTVDVTTAGEHKLMIRVKSSLAVASGVIQIVGYAWEFMEAA